METFEITDNIKELAKKTTLKDMVELSKENCIWHAKIGATVATTFMPLTFPLPTKPVFVRRPTGLTLRKKVIRIVRKKTRAVKNTRAKKNVSRVVKTKTNVNRRMNFRIAALRFPTRTIITRSMAKTLGISI